jgi:hypothetical protein
METRQWEADLAKLANTVVIRPLPGVAGGSKKISDVERAFRSLQSVELMVPPARNVRSDQLGLEQRFIVVFERAVKRLPGGVADQFKELLTPATLALVAGVLATWAASHFFGVGEAIDVGLVVIASVFFGWEAFTIAREFYELSEITINATSDAELDQAADILAGLISRIGVDVFLGFVMRLAAASRITTRGKRVLDKADDAPPKRKPKGEQKPKKKKKREPEDAETPLVKTSDPFKMTTARADKVITGKYGKYLDDSRLSGDYAQSRVKVMPVDDMRAEYKRLQIERYKANGKAIPPDALADLNKKTKNLGGFYSPKTKTVYCSTDVPSDSVLHESLHLYSDPAVKKQLGPAVNEGMTDYFTRAETGMLGPGKGHIPQTGCPKAANKVAEYAGTYGDDVMAKAYFKGDIGALEQTMGPETFNKFVGDVKASYNADMKALAGAAE